MATEKAQKPKNKGHFFIFRFFAETKSSSRSDEIVTRQNLRTPFPEI